MPNIRSNAESIREPLLFKTGEEEHSDLKNGELLEAPDNKDQLFLTVVFDLDGLTCAACVNTVRNAVNPVASETKNVRIGLFPSPVLRMDVLQENAERLKGQVQNLIEDVGFGCVFRTIESDSTLANGPKWKQYHISCPVSRPPRIQTLDSGKFIVDPYLFDLLLTHAHDLM